MLSRRTNADREMDAELRSHIELHAEDLIRAGMSRDDALRQARLAFGGLDRAKEECRDATGITFLESLVQDVRFGLRMLRKNPGFTVVAVLTLALGIGANAAIFSVAYNILLRPLSYRDAGKLVMVWENNSGSGFPQDTPAPGNYSAWKAQNNVFTDMAAYSGRTFNLTGRGNPEAFLGVQVTANMFPLLGVQPELGRNILPSEDKPGANYVAILSHAVWMANFGGDPNIIGKQLSLNDASYTIIGVMPRGFIFPDRTAQMWTPIGFSDAELANRGNHYLHVIARLKPGTSLKTANADMNVVAQNLQRQFPDSNAKEGAFAVPLRDRLAGSSQLAATILLGAVGFVLLIACANVANLLLARAAGRWKEFAMRMALGARRGRIVRQLLTESILLSAMSGAAGLLLAIWVTPFLARLIPNGFASLAGSGVNGYVLSFLVAVSLLCGVLFGLAPALRISRVDLVGVMKQGGGRGTGKGGSRVRDFLVIAEVALALVLFSGAALMLRSFVNVRDVDPGFRPAHVLALQTDLPSPKYDDVSRRNEFYAEVLDRVNHLPGVVAAGYTTWLPLTNWGGAAGISIEGQPELLAGHPMIPNWRMISGQYVQAIGMRLIEGRNFAASDGAETPSVALVNQATANAFWHGLDPVGTHFRHPGDTSGRSITVVGVVGDVRQMGLDQPSRPEIYFPYQQWKVFAPSYLAVRTAGDPMSVANAVRGQIWAVDKDQPVTGVMPLEQMLSDYLAPRELQSSLLGGFAGFALLLAGLGIYGVLAFSVAQHTQEIGVRVALGAQRRDILCNVLGQGLKLAAIGIAIGLAAALALSRLLSTLLFDISASDPLTFVGVSLFLACVALAACYIPARRAMRVDPVTAMRCE